MNRLDCQQHEYDCGNGEVLASGLPTPAQFKRGSVIMLSLSSMMGML
jgi:hypothetical protein